MRGFWLRLPRLLVYAAVTFPSMPLQVLFVALGSRLAVSFPRAYHRLCCRILGFRVVVKGEMSTAQPTLFVGNHVSYLDITILGAIVPGSFVAKAEVAAWPFFGWLAKLQRTVFVDRRMRTTHHQKGAMAQRLDDGDNLILFPEGTSGDGYHVLPFKSALLAAAELRSHVRPIPVQPVSIAYTKLDGMPLGRQLMPFFAWYGDMDLASHLWELLGLGVVTVEVEFHPAVTLETMGSRKALADYCRLRVMEGVAAALSGREPIAPTAVAAEHERIPAVAEA
jgi:1-acyl-sn-glycerol-3-phosphate acyltransferase